LEALGIQGREDLRDASSAVVVFVGVEKQHLVGFGDRLVMPQMAHVNTAIRKNQLSRGGALCLTLLPVAALAAHLCDGYDGSFQQALNGKFRQGFPSGYPERGLSRNRVVFG
jgi:hypothetical protein